MTPSSRHSAIRHTATLLLAVAASSPLMAQELEGTVTVKGVYTPEKIPVERVESYPTQMQFSNTIPPLRYDLKMVRSEISPVIGEQNAPIWGALRANCAKQGEVELGLGRWLDSYLYLGWSAICSDSQRLTLTYDHNSTSLWRPNLSEATADVKRQRYDEHLGVQYSRAFDGVGALQASGGYRLSYFNYYGYSPLYSSEVNPAMLDEDATPTLPATYEAPTQTVNNATWRATWHSAPYLDLTDTEGWRWYAGIDGDWMAYRSLYIPESMGWSRVRGERETRIGASAGLRSASDAAPISYGVDVKGDLLMYNKNRLDPSLRTDRNYQLYSVIPAWQWRRGNLSTRVGAKVDIALNAMGSEAYTKYSTVHVAPDMRADWRGTYVKAYLSATGGSQLQTLADAWRQIYYATPWLNSTQPMYTPVDARLGVSGAWQGVTLSVEGAYAIRRHVRVDGFYTAWLNYNHLLPGYPERQIPRYINDEKGLDLHGIRLSADLRYDLSEMLRIGMGGAFTPQKGEWGWVESAADLDRARIRTHAWVESTPISRLTLRASWEWRHGRRAYLHTDEERLVESQVVGGGGVPQFSYVTITDLASWRLPAYSMVNFDARYTLYTDWDITLQVRNILNRSNALLPSLTDSGISFTLGAAYRF